jgi:hypothetical protein
MLKVSLVNAEINARHRVMVRSTPCPSRGGPRRCNARAVRQVRAMDNFLLFPLDNILKDEGAQVPAAYARRKCALH